MNRRNPYDYDSFVNDQESRAELKRLRQKVYYFALFQLTMASTYLLVLYYFRNYILLPYKLIKLLYPILVFRLDPILLQFCFWMALNAARGVLHILSSFLLIWATKEKTSKLWAIRFCTLTMWMNGGFFYYESLVFLVIYSEYWPLGCVFVIYRILLADQVGEFISLLQSFVQSPPGHR